MENTMREHVVLHDVAGNARQPVEPSMIGSQLVLDLYECDVERLDDLEWVKATMIAAARAARATIVQTVFHQFAPWGISGVVVIAESHLAIHTWPEKRYAAIDLFTCGSTVDMNRMASRSYSRPSCSAFRCAWTRSTSSSSSAPVMYSPQGQLSRVFMTVSLAAR